MAQLQPASNEVVETEEGFTDFFEVCPAQVVAQPIEAVPDPMEVVIHPRLEAVADPAQSGVSLEEASRLLRLHVDTIKKRLRKGSLRGFKVQEKFGEKWFVSIEEIPIRDEVVTQPTVEAVPNPTQGVASPTSEDLVDPTQAVDGATLGTGDNAGQIARLVNSLERKDGVIESQAHQLRAAGDVIMYLRSQLEEKETHIKLLTDSQHKAGWWSRFCSWFVGQGR